VVFETWTIAGVKPGIGAHNHAHKHSSVYESELRKYDRAVAREEGSMNLRHIMCHGDCWVVTLKNKDYPKDYHPEHLYWVGVYIDVSSGAVRAIIPQNAFDEN